MKFYKTTITFEVLSADDTLEGLDLPAIYEETINGSASGAIMKQETVEITKEQAQQALVEQGSDPHFLDMEDCT